jgi:hypothetical protein
MTDPRPNPETSTAILIARLAAAPLVLRASRISEGCRAWWQGALDTGGLTLSPEQQAQVQRVRRLPLFKEVVANYLHWQMLNPITYPGHEIAWIDAFREPDPRDRFKLVR